MNRFLATLVTDLRLQHRNGFYYAVAFVLAMCALVISQLPDFDWNWWLPPLVLGNMVMVSFYFIGGLVLLEKREGTLEAQVVTPLRVREYLTAKVVTLTILSLIENVAVVMFFNGLQFNPLPLLIGIAAAAVLYALFGFMAVVRFDSINEYLMPSMLYMLFLSLPYLDYFGIWTSGFMLLHPLQGPLLAMKAALLPVPWVQLTWGLISTLVWIIVACWLSRRAFERFVVTKEGAH